eukprot:2832463-Amphidinium_carterae.1
MSERQMPSLEDFYYFRVPARFFCKCLHLQRLRNATRQMPSLEALEECQTAKCLHSQRLRNVRRQIPSLATFEECQTAKSLHLQRLRNVKAAGVGSVGGSRQIAG